MTTNLFTPNPLKGTTPNPLKGALSHRTAVKVLFRGFKGIALLALFTFYLLTLSGCKKDDTYTVSFNANGGSGTMTNQTFTEGVAQTLTLNTISHTTLHFNGWATSASRDVVYTDGQSLIISSNLALYAKWTAQGITGSPCPGMPTVTDCQGNLYNWAAAVAITDGFSQTTEFVTKRQGICPNGWHVPTDAEWATMQNYLIANGFNYNGSTSGNKTAKSLVEVSLGNKGTWNSYTGEGYPGSTTDSGESKRNLTGFSALPVGFVFGSSANKVGIDAYFWCANSNDNSRAWGRGNWL